MFQNSYSHLEEGILLLGLLLLNFIFLTLLSNNSYFIKIKTSLCQPRM